MEEKEPWQIAAARFCLDKQNGFTYPELQAFIHTEYPDVPDVLIQSFHEEEIVQPPGRQYARVHGANFLRAAPMELVSKIIDYDELKDARKNAEEARKAAYMSIRIALLAVVLSVVGFFITQDVRIVDDETKTSPSAESSP